MKRILSVFIAAMLVLVVCFAFSGCGSEPPAQTGGSQQGGGTEYGENGSVLLAYFSNTGNTEGVAEHIAEATGGDLREIVPEVPYTSADLDYGDDDSRAHFTKSLRDRRAVQAASAGHDGNLPVETEQFLCSFHNEFLHN